MRTATSTSTTPTPLSPAPPSPVGAPSLAAPLGQIGGRHPLTDFLVRRRNEGATPDEICAQLVATGWDADSAAAAALGSLRRADRHRLLYVAECWGAGLAALGAGSAAHLALTGAAEPLVLALFITLMLVAAPIGVVAGVWARRIEADDPYAIWSPTRRVLFATLASCTAVVGLGRLLSYTFQLVAAAVGADEFDFTPASVVQVMVTVSLATPLFWWALSEWRRSAVVLRSLGRADASVSSER